MNLKKMCKWYPARSEVSEPCLGRNSLLILTVCICLLSTLALALTVAVLVIVYKPANIGTTGVIYIL